MEANIFVSTTQIPSEYNIVDALSSPIAFTLDTGDTGYLLTDSQLSTLLETARLEVGNRTDTNFRGIRYYNLNTQGVPVDESSVFEGLPKRTGRRSRVSVIKWDGLKKDVFRKLTEKILAPAIPDIPICLSVPHGRSESEAQLYKKAGHFNILVWSGFKNSKLDHSSTKIWDIRVDCSDSPFVCSGEGIHPIMDGEYCVAEVFEDTLYIHHDLVHHGTDREFMIFRKILEETANILKNPELILAAREDRIRRNVKYYVDLCHKGSADKIKQLQRELRDAQSKVDEYKQLFIQQLRNQDRLNAEIPALENLTEGARDQFAKDYQRLCEYRDVTDIKVYENAIDIYTDHLYCVDGRSGLTHWMGRFRIHIDARGRNGAVLWKNLDFVIRGYESGMQAPHVFNRGSACLGSLEEVIPQYLAKWDFATLTQLAISFVQSVNTDDVAGSKVNRWPIAECSFEAAREQGINPEQHNKKYISKPSGGNG